LLRHGFSSHLADLSVYYEEYGLFHPDDLHPPLITDCAMPVQRFTQHFEVSYQIFSAGDYAVLYIAVSTYVWSSLYSETSVDAAVDGLSVAVTQAIDSAVSFGHIKKHKYPACISGKLRGCTDNKNYFYRRHKKYKAHSFRTGFPSTAN
jgi:hypothetical protein